MPTYALTERGQRRYEILDQKSTTQGLNLSYQMEYDILDDLSQGPVDLYPENRDLSRELTRLRRVGFIEIVGTRLSPEVDLRGDQQYMEHMRHHRG